MFIITNGIHMRDCKSLENNIIKKTSEHQPVIILVEWSLSNGVVMA